MTTYYNAVIEMFSLFNQTWNAMSSPIAGYVPKIYWQGVEDSEKPDRSKYFCRVSQRTVSEEQATIGEEQKRRRYRNIGFVQIDIFCPRSEVMAFDIGRRLSILARNTYRGKETASNIWFRNCRIAEPSIEPDSYRFVVFAEYEFDDVSDSSIDDEFTPILFDPPMYIIDGETYD